MPLATVKFAPGVNAEITPVQGMAQIIDSNLIRFKFAGQEVLPEKLGGWSKFYPVSLGSEPRDMHAWEGINNDTHLAIGCEESLNVITDGVGLDITPRTETTNPSVDFSTTNGSSEITIVDNSGFVPSIYMSIYILTQVSIGGLILQGAYQITSVLASDTYTIEAASDATATESNAGTVPEFTTVNGEPEINVELADHALTIGEIFSVAVSTTVGGLTLFGAYLVREVVDADNFVIVAANSATSTASASENGGAARIRYYIGIAPSPTSAGYGTGGYGEGGYGTGVVPTSATGDPITATNWTLDNWGEILLACPTGGPVYEWSPDSGFSNATKIVGAPEINGGIFVSQTAQILIAWASSTYNGVQDPLSINWSQPADYTLWTPTSQTQAGGYRLPTGSRIVGGQAGPNFNIIWTDLDVWAMDYIGPPDVYGFSALGSNCGLAARHGAVVLNSSVYWIGVSNFYVLNGESVQTIPCSVWDFIFQDLDTDNLDKIFAGSNSLFGEVTFYFPSASGGTGEVDKYVKFNPSLNTWDCGELARSAWIDQSPVGKPIGADPNGYIYQHEISPDADGQPMMPWFQTGYFAISDGEFLNFVDWLLPDFRYGDLGDDQDAILQITITYTDYPNGTVKTVGPYSVSNATEYVNTRLRGRFAALKIESQDLGSFWRLGGVKIRSVPDGKR